MPSSRSDTGPGREEVLVVATHRALTLATNTGSFLTAMAWLQAASTQVGGLKPFMLNPGLRRVVGTLLVALVVTWLVFKTVNWLIDKQLKASQALESCESVLQKLVNQSVSVGASSLSSAASYIMLYLWAAVLIGLCDTSTVITMWASVGLVTVGLCAVLAFADKGKGPFSGLHQGRSEQHKQTLQGMLVFNASFMLAVLWELAMELTFHAVVPQLDEPGLARLLYCLSVIVVCLTLRFAVPPTFRRVSSWVRGRQAVEEQTMAPLLQAYESVDQTYHVSYVASLVGHVASMVLTWVMGLAINFNVRGGVSTFVEPGGPEQWSLMHWMIYAVLLTLCFVSTSTYMELYLTSLILVAAAECGLRKDDLAAQLGSKVVQPEFQIGLTWFQENVLVPAMDLVAEMVRSDEEFVYGPSTTALKIDTARRREKHIACFNLVAAYCAGFAWNNTAAMVLTGGPAVLAPVMKHYWWYAVIATATSTGLSMVCGSAHAALRNKYGLLTS